MDRCPTTAARVLVSGRDSPATGHRKGRSTQRRKGRAPRTTPQTPPTPATSTDGRTTGKAVEAPDAELNGTKTTLFSLIAEAPVRGPLTVGARSEATTRHQLDRRDPLATVLGLGIISYAFSASAMVVGVALMGLVWVVLKLRGSADQACG